jgi:hypothetical protein
MNDVTTKPKAESKAPAAGPPEVAAAPAPSVPFRPLQVNRLKLIRSSESDFGNVHAAVLPAGTDFSDALRSDFWALVAHRLRPADQIEIHVDTQVFYGRLLVRDVTGTGANKTRAVVSQLERHHFDQLERTDEAVTHEIRHQGPHLRWCVIRRSDGKIVSDGHDSKEVAESALRNITRPKAA